MVVLLRRAKRFVLSRLYFLGLLLLPLLILRLRTQISPFFCGLRWPPPRRGRGLDIQHPQKITIHDHPRKAIILLHCMPSRPPLRAPCRLRYIPSIPGVFLMSDQTTNACASQLTMQGTKFFSRIRSPSCKATCVTSLKVSL